MAEETELQRTYGLANKREIWRTESLLRKYRRAARAHLAAHGGAVERESREITATLQRKGLLPPGAGLDAILGLTANDFLERRLQTQVTRRGLATTMAQARQLIVHGHISVGGRRVRVPSYLVDREEEASITYDPHSPVAHELHPIRARPRTAAPAAAVPGGAEGGEGE